MDLFFNSLFKTKSEYLPLTDYQKMIKLILKDEVQEDGKQSTKDLTCKKEFCVK